MQLNDTKIKQDLREFMQTAYDRGIRRGIREAKRRSMLRDTGMFFAGAIITIILIVNL